MILRLNISNKTKHKTFSNINMVINMASSK